MNTKKEVVKLFTNAYDEWYKRESENANTSIGMRGANGALTGFDTETLMEEVFWRLSTTDNINKYEKDMSNLQYLKNKPELTIEEADKLMFEHTGYRDMSFTYETTWDNYDKTYASPVFKFENGDRVVIDHYGVIRVLNK